MKQFRQFAAVVALLWCAATTASAQTDTTSPTVVKRTSDGRIIQPEADLSIKQTAQTLRFDWRSDGERHWLRINVRGADGKLLIVGNPIYLNWPAATARARQR